MSKPVKDLIAGELRRRFEGIDSALAINPVGLQANEAAILRSELKAKQIQLLLVKNSLAKRAFTGGPLEPLVDSLSGSNAIAVGGESIVDVAKEVVELRKTFRGLGIQGGIVEGTVLDEAGVADLANMPGRIELQGTVSTLALSPGSRLSGSLLGPFQRVAGCVQAIADKQEPSED
jgi:large subunit ribosomal protein L10